MIRTLSMLAMLATATVVLPASAEELPSATLYKNPQCGCCEEYAKYLRKDGFKVTVKPTHDLALISRSAGVPASLEGCHTMMIGGYVVEGHVPVSTLKRLLTERPNIKGISLPGMPNGSPGMSGQKSAPLTIYEIGSGKVYAVE